MFILIGAKRYIKTSFLIIFRYSGLFKYHHSASLVQIIDRAKISCLNNYTFGLKWECHNFEVDKYRNICLLRYHKTIFNTEDTSALTWDSSMVQPMCLRMKSTSTCVSRLFSFRQFPFYPPNFFQQEVLQT